MKQPEKEVPEDFGHWAPDPPWEWRWQYRPDSNLWYRSRTDPRERRPLKDLYNLEYKGEPVSGDSVPMGAE